MADPVQDSKPPSFCTASPHYYFMSDDGLPLGIKLIIGLHILAGIGLLGLGIITLSSGMYTQNMLLLSIVISLYGVFLLIAAYGLFKVKRWGWYLATGVIGLSLLLEPILLIYGKMNIVRALLTIVIFVYLIQNRDLYL